MILLLRIKIMLADKPALGIEMESPQGVPDYYRDNRGLVMDSPT